MILPDILQEFVESYSDLVLCKQSVRYPELRVLKYKNKVFYDNLWNEHPLLLECRGLVIDEDYNIIVHPFTKIFNYGENGTKIDRDELCTVTRKVNGFLGVATPYKGKLLISTTGSLDSSFCDLAAKHIMPFEKELLQFHGVSFCFEIIDKADPHIIEEKEGAHLIGVRFLKDVPGALGSFEERTLDCAKSEMKIGNYRPEWRKDIRFSDIVKEVETCQHEGFVVTGQESGTTLKLKSPFYLTTKLLARMKNDKLYKLISEGKPLRGIDEDYLPVIKHIQENTNEFFGLSEQGKISLIKRFILEELKQ